MSTTNKAPTALPREKGPSLRPALIVVALAVLIIVGGAALAIAGTSSARPASSGPLRSVPGSKLGAQSAKAVLAHIAAGGEPPADVSDALAVPAGSRYLGKSEGSAAIGPFDWTVKLSVDDPEAEVRTFYLKLLSEEHWVTRSITTPSRGSTEIIAERNGSDGYQWDVGLILSGVHTIVSPALAGGGGSAERTNYTIELYQVEDAS